MREEKLRNLFVGDFGTDGSTNKLHRSGPVVTENDAEFRSSCKHATVSRIYSFIRVLI